MYRPSLAEHGRQVSWAFGTPSPYTHLCSTIISVYLIREKGRVATWESTGSFASFAVEGVEGAGSLCLWLYAMAYVWSKGVSTELQTMPLETSWSLPC
jgi:hypothetical protein